MAVAGIVVPVTVLVWGSLMLAIRGFVLPDLGVHPDGQAATKRMSLPVMLLFASFILFIGFPAVT